MLFRGWWVLAFGPHYIDYGLLVGTKISPLLIEAEILLNTGRMDVDPIDPSKSNRQRYPLGVIVMNPACYVRIVPLRKEQDIPGEIARFRESLEHDLPEGAFGSW